MPEIMETAPINRRKGNRTQKARRNAPKNTERRVAIHNEMYAYTLEDPEVGSLAVLNSDQGAWWATEHGKVKIHKLIEAWKIESNDAEACLYAGITQTQLQYFQKMHPDVYTIKTMCRQRNGFVAKKTVAEALKKNPGMAMEYLKMKRKEEGYVVRHDLTSDGEAITPVNNEIVFVDFSQPAAKQDEEETEIEGVVDPEL